MSTRQKAGIGVMVLSMAFGTASFSSAASRFPRVRYAEARRLLKQAQEKAPGRHYPGERIDVLSLHVYELPAIELPEFESLFDGRRGRGKTRPTTVEMRVLGSLQEASMGVNNQYAQPSFELNMRQKEGSKGLSQYLDAKIRVTPATRMATIVEARSNHDQRVQSTVFQKEDPRSPYLSDSDRKRLLRLEPQIEKAKAWRFAPIVRSALAQLTSRMAHR